MDTLTGPRIEEWLQKQKVLLTGGSGFIGQGLLYKLLICKCPKVYILLRPKKGQTPMERLNSFFGDPIFDKVREEVEDVREKVVAISGDLTKPNFDMSDVDRKTLQEEVTLLIHCAASVSFDDPLTDAIFINIRATRDVIELAKTMKNLQVFHHVSTAYVNMDVIDSGVEEKLFAPPMDWRKLITAAETMPPHMLSTLEGKIIGTSPNTYIFTKLMTEALVGDSAKELSVPIVITRPTIILIGIKEPCMGWFNGLQSPVAICIAASKGILRAYYGPPDVEKAYCFLDDAVDTTIVSSWRHALEKNPTLATPSIYHICYYGVTSKRFLPISLAVDRFAPAANAVWNVRFINFSGDLSFYFATIFLHFLPGLLLDLLLVLSGSRPRLSRIYRKMYNAFRNLRPFLVSKDKIHVKNINDLKSLMTDEENMRFPLDMSLLLSDDDVYVNVGIKAVLYYRKLTGEPPFPSEKDFIHKKRLRWVEKCFFVLVAALILYIFPYNYVLSLRDCIKSSILFIFEDV